MSTSSKPVKRFWWLKLDKNFFKRHDVRIIQSMPNGEKYVLFYLKLLVESIDHEGQLRFSDEIPYTEEMISTIADTDIDIVRSALKLFRQLKLIELWEDQTIYLIETSKMLGSETEYAKKKREYRTNQKKQLDKPKTKKDIVRQELEKELEKELEQEQELYLEKELELETTEKTSQTTPTLSQINFLFNKLKLKSNPLKFYEYYNSTNWVKLSGHKVTIENLELNAMAWERREEEYSSNNPVSKSTDVTGYDTSVGEV